MVADNRGTLVIKPSQMEIGREYVMLLKARLLVVKRTHNENVMIWEFNDELEEDSIG